MRIGIVGIMQESNTFIAEPTTLKHFREDRLLVGAEQIREGMFNAHHEVSGFLRTLDEAGVEAVPLVFARALPAGTIAEEALDAILAMLWEQLEKAGPLDGILTAPHGANVSDDHPDMDGHWLSLLREWVGPEIPIVSTTDPHANLTPAMVEAVDAMTAYRTNPHLDQRERGVEAARLLLATLRGEIKPVMRAAFPPVAINIERQAPQQPPCLPLYDLAAEMRERPGVLTTAITLGFPYADVHEMGSAALAVTDDDPDLAQQLADELATYLVEHRADFVGQFINADDAIAMAMEGPGPVCLLDMGDNVGGGSPGDSPIIAHAFERYAKARGKDGKAFISLFDQASAAAARKAGPGARLTLEMGGKLHPLYGDPLAAQVTVIGLHDGHFTESQVRHYGMTDFDMGPTAIVETAAGLTIQLTSHRVYPTSLNQVITCGLDPSSYQILVAKGVHAPVAAYAPVCERIIRVNTPGVTCADMRQLDFKRRRRPLFPFEEIG